MLGLTNSCITLLLALIFIPYTGNGLSKFCSYISDSFFTNYIEFDKLKEDAKNLGISLDGLNGHDAAKQIEILTNIENVVSVSLGKRILRTETASSFVLSCLSYCYELQQNIQ